MPNSIGRRLRSTSLTEVEQLKQELAVLKEAYVRDMQNISTDMSDLSQKIDVTPSGVEPSA